jgi:stringent starvation protein B
MRAMHQWMTDNGLTPHLMVDATHDAVDVPRAHVREGRIVLNVGYDATRHLDIGNDWVTFEARFGGVPRQLRFPTSAVQSIYARETGEGLMFPPEEGEPPPGPSADPPASGPPAGGCGSGGAPGAATGGSKRPSLKVVK